MNQFKKFNFSFECRKAESREMFSLDEDHYENTDSAKYRKKITASNVPIVAIDVTTSLSLTGNRDWVLCIEYEVFI
jgi:hypothetical protein